MKYILAIVISVVVILIRMIAGAHTNNKEGGMNNTDKEMSTDELIITLASKNIGKKNEPTVVTINDIPLGIKYGPSNIKPGIHIGQRKLFLSEVQYLTEVMTTLDPSKKVEYVLYAGSAPSNKQYYLSVLFPNVKFILVDPAKFNINVDGTSHIKSPHPTIEYLKSSYGGKDAGVPVNKWVEYISNNKTVKTFLIEDYMTDDYAKLFAPLNVHLISDIRSNEHRTKDNTPNDLDVIWNMALQYIWVKIMNPKSVLFKFRTPYYEIPKIEPLEVEKLTFEKAKEYGIDFIKDFNSKKFVYLDGKINIQAWPGQSSSETRLISYPPYALREYSYNDYEDKLFYYNTVMRGFMHHVNQYANKSIGFDHCNDCSLESMIWNQYKNKLNSMLNVIGAVKHLSFIVKRPLFMGVHGHLYDLNSNYIKSQINKLENTKDE
jgi:hypothetical protein